jgi:hypothetical protein
MNCWMAGGTGKCGEGDMEYDCVGLALRAAVVLGLIFFGTVSARAAAHDNIFFGLCGLVIELITR